MGGGQLLLHKKHYQVLLGSLAKFFEKNSACDINMKLRTTISNVVLLSMNACTKTSDELPWDVDEPTAFRCQNKHPPFASSQASFLQEG